MSIPYIYRQSSSKVIILGEPENLIALGEMLILKGKMEGNFQATIQDNDGNSIEILTGDGLQKKIEQTK